ncbi:MAG: hypothetical protein FWF18_04870 [Dehalococcoidia bacterium]|nr:hypothetical protein [Dehalococcoidia bacterium]
MGWIKIDLRCHHVPLRVMLVFPAMVTMLVAMGAGALATISANTGLAIIGMLLGLLWIGILVLMALPQTDRWLETSRKWLKPLAVSLMVLLVICAFWYWKYCRRYPWMGVVLPLFALFFAWRSLWPYFFYVDIILLAMLLQEYGEKSRQSAVALCV